MTFDDGPDATWTPRLLDLLDGLGAGATFFPIAPRALAHADVIERILADGHAIGLHCHDHVRHSERDRDWLRRDTESALAALATLGVVPVFWRTPWGDTAPWTAEIALEFRLNLVGWSVDTADWRGDPAEAMFDATREDLVSGAIVLAHDGIGPGARRDGAGETLRYVELVADHARRHRLALDALA